MNEKPFYSSNSSVKSIWQKYHIYDDHLEFDTLFGKLSVPFKDIERVEIEESDVKGLFRGDLKLRNFRPALKLDWANFQEHIVIDKEGKFVKRILFTPDDVKEFKKILDEKLEQFRRRSDRTK